MADLPTQWLRLGWLTIIACNLVWVVVLFLHRRRNHPWLLPFFAVFTGIDILMLLLHREQHGGLNLFGVTKLSSLSLLTVWYVLTYILWVGWFVLVLLTTARLRNGPLGKLWWGLLAGLLVCCVGVPVANLHFGLSSFWTRLIFHGAVEPALLLASLWFLCCYCRQALRTGDIDIVALAIMLTIAALILRLTLALRPDLTMLRGIAQAFYFAAFPTFVVSYLVIGRRDKLWLSSLH